MDGRVLVTAFVASVGFVVGWVMFETLRSALFSAGFVFVIFVIDRIIDDYLYELPR